MDKEEQDCKTMTVDRLMERVDIVTPNADAAHSVERSFARIMARIGMSEHAAEMPALRLRRYRVWLAAASVALLMVAGGWLYTALSDKGQQLCSVVNNESSVRNVTLPDGTQVKLNGHSRLIYQQPFSRKHRDVALDGEAYFDVAHDASRPFTVSAGGLGIKVLGTRFTVCAYPSERKVETTLLEGSVQASGGGHSVLMKPSQQLVYDTGTGRMSLRSIGDTAAAVRWTGDVWVLERMPFTDICQRLELQYGVTIIVTNDKLMKKLFTGEFGNAEPLESVLGTLQASTPFRFSRRGNTIIIR